jgi:hypothetical protein
VVGHVHERLVTQTNTTVTLLTLLELHLSRVLGVHRAINQLGRLAVGNTNLLLALVQNHEQSDKSTANTGRSDKDTQHGDHTRAVTRRILGLEKEGTDNVTDGGSSVVKGDGKSFLGVTGRVGGEPTDNERVSGEAEESVRYCGCAYEMHLQECKKVVTEERRTLVLGAEKDEL